MASCKSTSWRRPEAAEADSPPRYRRSPWRPPAVVLVLLVLLVLPVGIWRAPPAAACTCTDSPNMVQLVRAAGAVFVGEPLALSRIYRTPYGETELWDFAVERVYAGPNTARIAVGGAADGDSCHVELGGYGRVGIVANWRSGHLSVGRCGIFDADGMVGALGEGTVPKEPEALSARDDGPAAGEAAARREGALDHDDAGSSWLPAAAVAGLAAVSVVLLLYRRRQSLEEL